MSNAKSTFQFTVNPAQAVEFITEALFAGLVPMMAGSPGIGKSQIVKKIARNLNLELIDIRLSQMDSVDLCKQADYIIYNDNEHLLISQTVDIINKLENL